MRSRLRRRDQASQQKFLNEGLSRSFNKIVQTPNFDYVAGMAKQKISEILQPQAKRRHVSPLQRLLDQSAKQKTWTAAVRAVVEPNLRAQFTVTSLQHNKLNILCSSAAIATRMRFSAPDLLADLKCLDEFKSVTDIQCRVSHATE